MKQILILGAGGHAQVVADILHQRRAGGEPIRILGYLDDNPVLHGRQLLNYPVLGRITDLPAFAHDAILIAIGDNLTRCALNSTLAATGECLASAGHPAATLGLDVDFGVGTVICAGVVVNACANVEENVILNTGCTVDHHNHIGAHAHIGPGAHLGGDVRVGEGALIGIGAIVMPQCTVGKWAIVGAGAVVTTDVPDYAVVVGTPARIVKWHGCAPGFVESLGTTQ